jgi:hypothetical protein
MVSASDARETSTIDNDASIIDTTKPPRKQSTSSKTMLACGRQTTRRLRVLRFRSGIGADEEWLAVGQVPVVVDLERLGELR